MKWLKKKQGNAFTAMRSKNDSTYIVTVSRPKNGKPLIEKASTESINLNSSDAVKKITQQYDLDKNRVTYLLEGQDSHHIQLEKPKVPDGELKEAVRWAIKDSINIPVDEITLDLVEIPAGQNGEDITHEYIYAMYAHNHHIAALSNSLIKANVNLRAIDTRIMAQRNISNHLATPGEAQAILSFSSTGALLTFTYEGELCNARHIEISDEHSDTSFEKTALEIQRSLDGFESNFRNMYVKKLLIAPFDLRHQFCEHLGESIYVPVETFELSDIFDYGPGVEINSMAQQASYMPILGAALREDVA